jgi:DNA polymerase-3 subunit epsilon
MVAPTQSPRTQAILEARNILALNPVYLDTETTGLDKSDEIVEISVVDDSGAIIFTSLVRPSQPIPMAASNVHGITDDMVRTAQAWPIVWLQLRPLLLNKVIIAYNSDFDYRMLQQSHARYRQPWKDNLRFFDLLKLYAKFRGEWDPSRRSYRYFSLDAAGKHSGIALPNAHRSTADTLLTRALLHFIAEMA